MSERTIKVTRIKQANSNKCIKPCTYLYLKPGRNGWVIEY